jgi:hypothetical protein
LLLFRGPGEIERLRAAVVGRQWGLLLNTSASQASRAWPSVEPVWRKRHVDEFFLDGTPDNGRATDDEEGDRAVRGSDWIARIDVDERRPGRRSLLLQTGQVAIAVTPSAQQDEPPPDSDRLLILDASWTHVQRFPEREEIREALIEGFQSTGRVFFVTSLPWDAEFFQQVAADLEESSRAVTVLVAGSGERMRGEARLAIPNVGSEDTVLLGLVPGRDDRGALQRLRSEFAERTVKVSAFPTSPLSSGPGPGRDEALTAVGLWLPTRVLIAGGPISEQYLLARYLEESTGGYGPVVGVAGGEYRLPSLDLIRHADLGRRVGSAGRLRVRAGRLGLVIVSFGPDDSVQLSGFGLPDVAMSVLPKLRIVRRNKTPDQITREVESAFSSRGMPAPAVKCLT